MKVTMAMTLDGMLKALRWRVHVMAEEIEAGYPSADRLSAQDGSTRRRATGPERGDGDDRIRD